MRISIRYSILIMSVVLLISLIACGRMAHRAGHPRVGGVVIEAPGPCTDYSGIWSTNLGKMELNQVGCRVNGAGNFEHGYADIDGEVLGGQLEFHWEGKHNSGWGYLIVDEANDSISGEWGYGDEFTGGGAIKGNRLR